MAPEGINTNGMQAHLDACDAAHPDQQSAHLRGEHGWTIFESEETDLSTLRAMHRVAHQHDTDQAQASPLPVVRGQRTDDRLRRGSHRLARPAVRRRRLLARTLPRDVPGAEGRAVTIDQLIEAATEARDELGGDAEVRLCWQPEYPIRGTLQAVTVPEDDPYDEGETAAGQENDAKMLWLAAGAVPYGENPYAGSWAWQGAGAW